MTRNETFNGRREFLIAGKFFILLSTVNPVDVYAYAADGTLLQSELQVEAGYWIDRRDTDNDGKMLAPFDRIAIVTGANEAVKFAITDGQSGTYQLPANVSDRAGRLLGIVYGTLGQLLQQVVSTFNALAVRCLGLPGGDDVTAAGLAFTGFVIQTAGAATNSHIGLKNPATSTAIVYVDKIVGLNNGATTTSLQVTQYDTDLTTDAGAGVSKSNGGTAAQAHLRSENFNGTRGTVIDIRGVGIGLSGEFVFTPPLRLVAGKGIAMLNGTQNVLLSGSFQWRELAA